jgi:CelD/BcsL family acetyltransferase involved in cellulose biosynthesis
MSIDFELATGLETEALGRLWRELEGRANAPFFLSWDWIGNWIMESETNPHVLIGRVDGRVVLLGALAQSARHSTVPFLVNGLRLHTLGDDRRDVITIEYNGFLVDPVLGDAAEDAAVRFLMQSAQVQGRRFDELHLRSVARSYAAVSLELGLRHKIVSSKPSYRIDLDTIRDTGKPYLDTLSANTRQQIRRSMRLYEQRGKLVATRARDVPEALDYLAGLKSLHQPYWASRGKPGAFSYPFFEKFQRRLIGTGIQRGTVELVRIACGEVVIGYLYNFVHRGQAYAYQSGFRFDDDPRLKPGLVSHCLCIEMHRRDGTRIYDFMAGEARYKASLGKPGPDMTYALLQRPTLSVRIENVLHRLDGHIQTLRSPHGPAFVPVGVPDRSLTPGH